MAATKLNVMLVEDDDFTRATVKSALQGQGLNVVYDPPLVKEVLSLQKKIDLMLLFLITT